MVDLRLDSEGKNTEKLKVNAVIENLLQFVTQNLGLTGVGVFVLFAWWRIASRKQQTQTAQKILSHAVESAADEPISLHPQINLALCAGCGSCTQVCPEGDILKLINHQAVLVSPTKCVGHGECEQACPQGAISLVFGTKKRGMDIPRITGDYETNVPGLYIAGELGGMGLIRNAVKQGVASAKHAIEQSKKIKAVPQMDVQLLVIGAGPSGIAAALTAHEAKIPYLCIEQGSFGGTIANFPRQKIVMSHPADLPIVGKMKFAKNKISKEELLEFWGSIRQKTGLRVKENVKFETLKKVGEIFEVTTSAGVIRAAKVILCLGVRGTPRKLGIPNENLSKVTYNLLEPEQYKNRDVAVVGAGNAALEAAHALAQVSLGNRVTLIVRGKGFDRSNEENQKKIRAMSDQGRVKVLFESTVKEITQGDLSVQTPAGLLKITNQYLFIFAGAQLPHQFLMSLGIAMDKKFGESLKKGA